MNHGSVPDGGQAQRAADAGDTVCSHCGAVPGRRCSRQARVCVCLGGTSRRVLQASAADSVHEGAACASAGSSMQEVQGVIKFELARAMPVHTSAMQGGREGGHKK